MPIAAPDARLYCVPGACVLFSGSFRDLNKGEQDTDILSNFS